MDQIHFGTDGWRAVIADEFTFENVRKVTQAIAVAATALEPPDGVKRDLLVVGYDRRFLSREFAQEVSLELSKSGFDVLLSDVPLPSPAVSHAVTHHKALGGVIVTASHNPARYNGIKFKAWYGGSALPEIYSAIVQSLGKNVRRGGGSINELDLTTEYVAAIRRFIAIDLLRDAQLRILHDAMFGVSAGLPARILGVADSDRRGRPRQKRGGEHLRAFPIVKTIRGEANPSFGDINPEPIPENLDTSSKLMSRGGYDLAICNDGDSDRLGILDEKGRFVSPHKILSLLTLYLVRTKGMGGSIVKTFSTTRLIERIAKTLGAELHETPIGFKYVADLMLSSDVLLGGEESGGIGFGAFLPERDGILSGLLVAECVAAYRKPLSQIIEDMEEEFGALHYDRRDVYRSREACERLIARVKSGELDDLLPMRPESLEEKDGVKLNFQDGSWLLFRRSGTEPMIRIYCESPSGEMVQRMLDRAVGELDRN